MITEINVFHLQELLSGRTNTFEAARLREVEFQSIRRGELKVVLCLGLFLNKLTHFTFVMDEPAVGPPDIALFIVDDIGGSCLQERCVVRHGDNRLVIQRSQIVRDPLDS